MMCVCKYALGPTTVLQLPRGARPLSVGWQGDGLFLWCLVYPDEKITYSREFVSYWTGEDIPFKFASQLSFIGTTTHNDLVYHTFEVSAV